MDEEQGWSGYNVRCCVLVTLLGAFFPSIVAKGTSQTVNTAGSHVLPLKSEQGDVGHVIATLGGIPQCSQVVNTRVDQEFLNEEMISPCRGETAGYDIVELLQPSHELLMPSETETMTLCRSGAYAVWLHLVTKARWLSECTYRQSQVSLRSLAETLLRIREELVVTGVSDIAPSAAMFRELYEINQLANVLRANQSLVDQVSVPVVQVARRLIETEALGSEDQNLSRERLNAASTDSIGSPDRVNTSNTTIALMESSTTFNSSDLAGFTSGDKIGPHASTTATTTVLTLSYVYLIGAWVLFNGSYFFLMRRK
ncbi:hypothetical protein PsorP6_015975 [Peronosclerospora sorghi]|uniref:Uncharacterized protein n=1 Tax=Peronosclerospora sorghi TaxID=230839 RepID=A0ACC0WM76_9STRA|nr:hypothetical protein PsorP6_015975 [Peronosclerospora sorghi]